ncbi:MAG: hypothetical protein WD049_02360, partial [Candidatus Paceibacterota bacterium]
MAEHSVVGVNGRSDRGAFGHNVAQRLSLPSASRFSEWPNTPWSVLTDDPTAERSATMSPKGYHFPPLRGSVSGRTLR